jgi:hypothetical protein
MIPPIEAFKELLRTDVDISIKIEANNGSLSRWAITAHPKNSPYYAIMMQGHPI